MGVHRFPPIANPNCPLPGTGPGPINCLSSVLLPLSIATEASALANQFDASKFIVDMNGSNVVMPNSGLFNITLNNSSGQPVSQASFSWTKNGNIITVNNPVAVHDWMASVPASVKSIKAQFVSMPVDTHVGVNAYMLSVRYNGTVQANAGQVWMESCNTGSQVGFVRENNTKVGKIV